MAEELTQRRRTIHQRDLYDEHVSLSVRLAADRFDDGDNIRITVEKLNPVRDEGGDTDTGATATEETAPDDTEED